MQQEYLPNFRLNLKTDLNLNIESQIKQCNNCSQQGMCYIINI